jgi:type IV pilus assembly protein PilW
VLAAIGSLVFTQATSAVVDDSSRLQQKADAVFRNIGYHIAQAGSFELIGVPAAASSSPELPRVVFSSLYTGFNTSPTGSVYNIYGLQGTSNATDSVGVSYEKAPDPAAPTDTTKTRSHDCLGNKPAGANANVDSKFYVNTTTKDLMCLGVGNTTAQSIADGIEDFQVWYGVRTTNDPSTAQYRYYDAGTVPDWTRIQSVRICLHTVGDNRGNPQSGLSFVGCHSDTITPTDGLLHRVFWRTFSLRNALL